VDNGFEQGMDVPIYYDPMLSKLITYGKDRDEAIQLMLRAIESYRVEGVQTTLPFGRFVFEHEAFRSGRFDTHFVANYYSPDMLREQAEKEANMAAHIALFRYMEDTKKLRIPMT
ncbi:MAG: biotin carboxylase, partial [Flavobacteriaceae bacterium]